jgi:hypothetical protein
VPGEKDVLPVHEAVGGARLPVPSADLLPLDLDWLEAVLPVTLRVTVAVPSSLRVAVFSCSGSPSVGVSASAATGDTARLASMAMEAMVTAIPASLLAVAAADESSGLIGGPRLG